LTSIPPPARTTSETKGPSGWAYGPLWFIAGLPIGRAGPDARQPGPVPSRRPVPKIGGVDCAEVWTAVAACGAPQRRPASG